MFTFTVYDTILRGKNMLTNLFTNMYIILGYVWIDVYLVRPGSPK